MDKIAVIVLNWNQADLTIGCLNSLLAAKKGKEIELEIVLVDNYSYPEEREKLKTFLRRAQLQRRSQRITFTLIENKRNLGFTGGNNQGIKYALKNGASYVFILNNDTKVEGNCLLNLWQVFQNKKKTGIAVPKIYYAPGFEFHKERYRKEDLGKVIWYGGGKIDWKNILGKHMGVDEIDKGQFNIMKQVEFATGCAMMVKKDVFENVGFFDDRFFLYLEDLDFSYRVAKAGFKIVFSPQAIVYHFNAGSSGSGSKLQQYYITRNRLLFAWKHASWKMKMLLFKEAARNFFKGSPAQKEAIKDFFLGKFGYKNIEKIK